MGMEDTFGADSRGAAMDANRAMGTCEKNKTEDISAVILQVESFSLSICRSATAVQGGGVTMLGRRFKSNEDDGDVSRTECKKGDMKGLIRSLTRNRVGSKT